MENLLIVEKPWIWREALYKSDLPASALRVGLALVEKFLNRTTGNIFPSHETIASECRMSIETVRTGLKVLKEFGMITTRKSGFNSSLNYLLHAAVVISRDAKGVFANWSKSTTRTGQIRPPELGKSDHLTFEGNLQIEPEWRSAEPTPPLSPAVTLASIPSESQEEASVVAPPELPEDYEVWIKENAGDRALHRHAIHLLWSVDPRGGSREMVG